MQVIENLSELTNLESLFLGKNKITQLNNLESLSKLKLLSIQSNRIVSIANLEKLTNLEELYLSHNGIQVLLVNITFCIYIDTISSGN
jgi:protein phosphatase 1 regulatory subunit 7